ncbi:hypothetical protein J3A83DRAFT_4193485 [Scleroderma citrinum]
MGGPVSRDSAVRLVTGKPPYTSNDATSGPLVRRPREEWKVYDEQCQALGSSQIDTSPKGCLHIEGYQNCRLIGAKFRNQRGTGPAEVRTAISHKKEAKETIIQPEYFGKPVQNECRVGRPATQLTSNCH